jgi:hypothetical protein
MRSQSIIDSLFEIPVRFINDDGLAFAAAVYSLILVFHALLGSAEIVTGAECRFLNPKFWFRILFFGFVIAGFDTAMVPFAKKIASLSFDQFLVAYKEAWTVWSQTTQKLLANASQQQNAEFSLLQLHSLLVANLLDALASMIGLVLTFILSALILLLTFIMGFVGTGLSAGTLCLAPVALVFGAFEATEAVALSYLKTFLVYCVLYMPMLALAMQIAVVIQAAANPLVMELSQQYALGHFAEHLFLLLVTPLAAFALVFSVPSITSRIFH